MHAIHCTNRTSFLLQVAPFCRMPKSKKRNDFFNENHTIDYGLKVADRDNETSIVSSVMCRFCFTFGREGQAREGQLKNDDDFDDNDRDKDKEWKRNASHTIKYFKSPFRIDKYTSHLKCHPIKWEEYRKSSTEKKRKFFDIEQEAFANTLHSHFTTTTGADVLMFETDIIESLIGELLFDPDDELFNDAADAFNFNKKKDRAMSIFKKYETGEDGYYVEVKNKKQYDLCTKYVALSMSFNQIVQVFRVTKEVTHVADLGSVNKEKVISYCRTLLADSLQTIKNFLTEAWCYSVAFDGSTYQHSSYFDIRLRVYFNGDIQNIHVLAVPMFDRHTGEYMFELFQKLFNVLDPLWREKLIGVTSDGARSMTGSDQGVVTRIQREVIPFGFYRIWCALHQLDLVVQKTMKKFFDTVFYKNLTATISHLRRQQNLIQDMKSKCPLVADTRWLSLGQVCDWFVNHRIKVCQYFDSKDPRPECTPTPQWWICVAVVQKVMKEVDKSFVANQGLRTLVHEQKASLAKLRRNLLQDLGATFTADAASFDTNEEDVIIFRHYKIVKDDIEDTIKDCGVFYEEAWNGLAGDTQKTVWRSLAKTVLAIVTGIDEVEDQNVASTGTAYPPVLPHQLVKMRSFQFNEIVSEHRARLLTEERFELVQKDHQELLRAYRDDENIRKEIDSTSEETSFKEGWKCISGNKFAAIKEFCGGLATIFPGTATVESDFSIVNYEKDQYRTALTDFSLEGILHAKQYDLITSFKVAKTS